MALNVSILLCWLDFFFYMDKNVLSFFFKIQMEAGNNVLDT